MLKITKCADPGELIALAEKKRATGSWNDNTGLYLVEWSEELDPFFEDPTPFQDWVFRIRDIHPLANAPVGGKIEYTGNPEQFPSALDEMFHFCTRQTRLKNKRWKPQAGRGFK